MKTVILTREDLSFAHRNIVTSNVEITHFKIDAKVEYLMADKVFFEDGEDNRKYRKVLKGQL